MGIRGAALSTVFARIYLVLVLLIAVLMVDRDAFTEFRDLRDGAWKLLRIGFPAALTIGFEVGVFNASTAIVGTLDPVSLAAHTIALNAASVTYMVPLGIGSAAAVSVGRALGAGDRRQAARAGWTAIGIGVVFEIFAALSFIVLPRQIAEVYTHDERVISFSVTLLAIAAVFQLFDGLQTIAGGGALRGAGNTMTPNALEPDRLLVYRAAAWDLALLPLEVGRRGTLGRAVPVIETDRNRSGCYLE